MPAYQLRLYKRREGRTSLHDHMQSIELEAYTDEAAAEKARLMETPLMDTSDCAILFRDGRDVVALWQLHDL